MVLYIYIGGALRTTTVMIVRRKKHKSSVKLSVGCAAAVSHLGFTWGAGSQALLDTLDEVFMSGHREKRRQAKMKGINKQQKGQPSRDSLC